MCPCKVLYLCCSAGPEAVVKVGCLSSMSHLSRFAMQIPLLHVGMQSACELFSGCFQAVFRLTYMKVHGVHSSS